jgi:hypothetical protein
MAMFKGPLPVAQLRITDVSSSKKQMLVTTDLAGR